MSDEKPIAMSDEEWEASGWAEHYRRQNPELTKRLITSASVVDRIDDPSPDVLMRRLNALEERVRVLENKLQDAGKQ